MVSIIAATAATGLVLLAVAFFIMWGMDWRSYAFTFGQPEERPEAALGRLLADPATWAVGFVVLVLAVGAVALAAVGAIDLPVPGGNTAVLAIFGGLLTLFLVLGTYGLMRDHDSSTAEAVAASVVMFAGLFVLGVSAMLVLG